MKYLIPLVMILVLPSCATTYEPATPPRALQIGAMQPYCFFACTQTSIATDAESGATQTSTTSSQQDTTLDYK